MMPETVLVWAKEFIFSMNHTSLKLIIFSISLDIVLRSEIGRYPDVLNLSFPSLGVGIMQLCFQLEGMMPELHIKLNI